MQFLHVAAAHHHSGLKCRLPALVEKAKLQKSVTIQQIMELSYTFSVINGDDTRC